MRCTCQHAQKRLWLLRIVGKTSTLRSWGTMGYSVFSLSLTAGDSFQCSLLSWIFFFLHFFEGPEVTGPLKHNSVVLVPPVPVCLSAGFTSAGSWRWNQRG